MLEKKFGQGRGTIANRGTRNSCVNNTTKVKNSKDSFRVPKNCSFPPGGPVLRAKIANFVGPKAIIWSAVEKDPVVRKNNSLTGGVFFSQRLLIKIIRGSLGYAELDRESTIEKTEHN